MKKSILKNQLENMDDATLKQLISALASTAGIPRSKVQAITDDIPTLRAKLASMSDGQFDALIAMLGKGGS